MPGHLSIRPLLWETTVYQTMLFNIQHTSQTSLLVGLFATVSKVAVCNCLQGGCLQLSSRQAITEDLVLYSFQAICNCLQDHLQPLSSSQAICSCGQASLQHPSLTIYCHFQDRLIAAPKGRASNRSYCNSSFCHPHQMLSCTTTKFISTYRFALWSLKKIPTQNPFKHHTNRLS